MITTDKDILYRKAQHLTFPEWSIMVNNGLWKPRDFDLVIIELIQYALRCKVS